MATENGEAYTPKHAIGPIEPLDPSGPIEPTTPVEPAEQAAPAEQAVYPERVAPTERAVHAEQVEHAERAVHPEQAAPAEQVVRAEQAARPEASSDGASGNDFDTDQMKSLSFLYGADGGAGQGASAARPQRSGPRHVGRTQHPADFTASKYLGDGALKSSSQRKSSDYKNPASSRRRAGARHSEQATRATSQDPEQPKGKASAARTQVVAEPSDSDRTRVLEPDAPARREQPGRGATRVLPSERARAAVNDETMIAPASKRRAAQVDETRIAPAPQGAQPKPSGKPGKRKGKRRGPKIAVIVVVVIIAAIAVCAALLFRSVQQVQADALELNKVVSTIADDFRAGELDKVGQSVDEITEIADRMEAETSSPLWKAASVLPVIGDDAANATVLCDTIEGLSDEVLVPLFADLAAFDSMSDADKLAFATRLAGYKDKVSAAKEAVEALDEGRIDQVNNAVDKAEDLLAKAEILLG